MNKDFHETYIVREKVTETPNVSTLLLTLTDGSVPKFIPGQFITVYFPETKTAEGKAYSISSAPFSKSPTSTVVEIGDFEKTMAITVKAIGEFSNRLCGMKPGDTITASLPYGYFTNEDCDDKNTLVLLAAGIGIAPFRSIIRDTLRNKPSKKIALFYSNKTLADTVFKKEFDALREANRNFSVHYFVTQEKNVPADIANRRMTAEDVLKDFKSPEDLEFMICGSISFTRDIWRALHAAGVPEDQIATEAFFS